MIVLDHLPALEAIDTDRPHQTDTPHVVPQGHTQFEAAIAAIATGRKYDPPHVALMDLAYKWGYLPDCDFQLLFKHAEWDTGTQRFVSPGPLEVRTKLALVHESGWRPAITLVPELFVPFARNQALRAGLILFWGWELPFDFELEMNAGFLVGSSPKNKKATVVVLASALTKRVAGKLKAFVDIYATGWDIQLGTGLLYPVGRDVQIDAGTYIGLNGDVAAATPFIGVSYRR